MTCPFPLPPRFRTRYLVRDKIVDGPLDQHGHVEQQVDAHQEYQGPHKHHAGFGAHRVPNISFVAVIIILWIVARFLHGKNQAWWIVVGLCKGTTVCAFSERTSYTKELIKAYQYPTNSQPKHTKTAEQLKPNFAWLPTDRIKATLNNTTQLYKTYKWGNKMKRHFKSRYPRANLPHSDETVATDTKWWKGEKAHNDGTEAMAEP